MDSFSVIKKYFPFLGIDQLSRLERLGALYSDWNTMINVISRKDIDSLNERHILHSLALAKFIDFNPSSKVMDIGTGGGFPGIPLAIYFPNTQFSLVDSIGKKIRVVQAIANELGLTNVKAIHGRVEDVKDQFDFIVSRATAPLSDLINWSKGKIKKENNHTIKNGIIALKGGDLADELAAAQGKSLIKNVSDYYSEPFFSEKKVLYWHN